MAFDLRTVDILAVSALDATDPVALSGGLCPQCLGEVDTCLGHWTPAGRALSDELCEVLSGVPGVCGFDVRDADLWGATICPSHPPVG